MVDRVHPVMASTASSLARPMRSARAGMQASTFLFYGFLFSMFLPTSIAVNLGFMRLTPYRLFLIAFVVLNASGIISNLRFNPRNPGFYILICGGWCLLSLWINHDLMLAIETGGIYVIELAAPFFIVAAYVRGIHRFQKLVNVLIVQVILLLSISIPETLTGFNWFRTLTDAISRGYHSHINPRFGFERALATFDHPIINGVISSSVIGFVFFCRSRWQTILPIVGTATSLSSGAVASIIVQMVLIAWQHAVKVRIRWKIFSVLILVVYLSAELISNRSGVMAILGLLVFSANTAYNRYYIWIYGTDNVEENPFFGIGYHDWVRPTYMGDSIDNFWLVLMMRYGLPAFLAYVTAILIICRSIFRYRVKDKNLTSLRRGWLCGLAGLAVSAGTVHYWNAAVVYFNFYIGLGFALSMILADFHKNGNSGLSMRKSPSER